MARARKDDWDALVARYRRLLVAEPSGSALDDAIQLIQEVAECTIITETDRELAALDQEESLDATLRAQLSEDIQEFAKEKWQEESVRRRRKREYLQLQRLANRTVGALWTPVYLCTHDLPIPDRAVSLAIDVGLIVFHQAYFDLLERLPPAFDGEREAVYSAFMGFSDILPATPDALRIKSLIFELRGDQRRAGWYLREAVRTTPAENHEFLTVLQSAWAHLVEASAFRQAMLLLQENAHRVSERDYDEFRELFGETADLERGKAAS